MQTISVLDGVVVIAKCKLRKGREKFIHICTASIHNTETAESIEIIEKVVWINNTLEKYQFETAQKRALISLYTRTTDIKMLNALKKLLSNLEKASYPNKDLYQ